MANRNVTDITERTRRISLALSKGRDLIRPLSLLALTAALAAGCALPQAPGDLSWDSHLIVPFGVRTYGLIDLVQPDSVLRTNGSGIGMGDDSLLCFSTFTALSVPFRDSLRLDAITDTLYKPEWVADSSGVYDIPEQNQRIYLARVYTGELTITTSNLSGVSDTAVVTLMNLQTPLGEPAVITQFVPADSEVVTVLDLFNYRLQLADETPQTATAVLSASLGSVLFTVVHLSPLTFSYYDGELNDLLFTAQSEGTAVRRLPEGWDAVHPATVDAYLSVLNGVIGLAADVDAVVRTYLFGSPLTSRHVVIPDLPLGTDTTAVVHDLASLVATYPDSFSAAGSLTLSGRVESHIDETMSLDVELRAPLGFTLEPMHFPGEVVRIDNDDLRDTQTGSARVRIWNRLPVGGRVFLVADKDSLRVLPDAGADVDTVADVNIPMPPIEDGRATTAAYTEFEIGLSESALDLLRDPPFFSRTDVRLEGSGGDTLVAHAADWVKVQIVADIVYRMDTGGSQ